jgi:hypothetical protein
MSATNKRKQVGWWLPASLLLIAAIIAIRYASSQGWWGNPFDSNSQPLRTINAGFSVQIPNQSGGIPADVQNSLNSLRSSQTSTSTGLNQTSQDGDQGRRALW